MNETGGPKDWHVTRKTGDGRAAVLAGAGIGVRVGLGVVAVAGLAAAVLILALPRLAASRGALHLRLGPWLSPRNSSRRRASEAWALVSACWLVRAVAFFLLLGTLGVGFSFPLALLFLCAGATAAALDDQRTGLPSSSFAAAWISHVRIGRPASSSRGCSGELGRAREGPRPTPARPSPLLEIVTLVRGRLASEYLDAHRHDRRSGDIPGRWRKGRSSL
jgi:hypothetical protein